MVWHRPTGHATLVCLCVWFVYGLHMANYVHSLCMFMYDFVILYMWSGGHVIIWSSTVPIFCIACHVLLVHGMLHERACPLIPFERMGCVQYLARIVIYIYSFLFFFSLSLSSHSKCFCVHFHVQASSSIRTCMVYKCTSHLYIQYFATIYGSDIQIIHIFCTYFVVQCTGSERKSDVT